jgi:AbiU2
LKRPRRSDESAQALAEENMANTIQKNTRELYQHLRSEVIGVHYRWKIFRQLFFSQEVVDLLNSSAGRFFSMLRLDLLDLISLALGRLTDSSKSLNKYPNVTLEQLIDSLDPNSHSELITVLRERLTDLKSKCARIENWRNKWAAHRDLHTVIEPITRVGFSPSDVETVLAALRSFMNEFERVCQDTNLTYIYDNNISPEENGEFFRESERLKIGPPTDYQEFPFADDGNTIIEILRKAAKQE